MELKNHMETVVLHKLDKVLAQFPKCCTCDTCKRDIVMLTLNNLPARYVATRKGDIFARVNEMEMNYDVEIVKQMAKAISIVQEHPRHGEQEA